MVVSACASDPLKRVERLSEVAVAPAQTDAAPVLASAVAAVAAEGEPLAGARGGFLSRILQGSQARRPETPSMEGTVAEAVPIAAEAAPVAAEDLPKAVASGAAETVPGAARAAGLFGLLRGEAKAEKAVSGVGGVAAVAAPKEAASEDVAPGQRLAAGKVGRVCDLAVTELGAVVERSPDRGARYKIHDTAPGTAQARTLYISGFADGCPRQVTGALAMFGSAARYEELRYGAPGKSLPKGASDAAYEEVKSTVCGVAKGRPCGKNAGKMDSAVVFVSIYQSFGDNGSWATLLLHDGRVAAADLKAH